MVKDGAPTNDPHRVLTPSDFLCSARILHAELMRQTNREKQASCDEPSSTFRQPTKQCHGHYPFTVDVALSRLPVRLLVRNYGVPPAFRDRVTAQVLDNTKIVLKGELCYDQRVLVHAVRHSRTSVDSLLKNADSTVQGDEDKEIIMKHKTCE